MILKMLLNALLAYLEKHPDQVVELMSEGAAAAIAALKKAREDAQRLSAKVAPGVSPVVPLTR